MDYKGMAKDILAQIGGAENMVSLVHCATRLRFELADMKLVNETDIRKIQGVKGVMDQKGQFQIIVGSDVGEVYREIMNLTAGVETGNVKAAEEKKAGIGSRMVNALTSIFTPILPAITGAGMLKALLAAAVAFGWLKTEGQNYIILNSMADAAFYFLPILVGWSASKFYQTKACISLTLAGILLYPSFMALMGAGEAVYLFGIPVTAFTYSSSVIPIILIVWLESYVERWLYKHIHESMKFFVAPMLVIFICGFIGITILGPIGAVVGNGVAAVMNFLIQYSRIPGMVLIGVLGPFIGMTGIHQSFTPITIAVFSQYGFDPLMFPATLAGNMAQCGAALAVAVRAKNKSVKSQASSASLTALMGITEPALFGVALRFKTPFVGVMIGGGIGALVAGILSLKAYAIAGPGLASIAMFIGGDDPKNIIYAAVTMIVSIAAAFAATWILGGSYTKESLENE